jgi:hypothetical protein
MNIELAVDVIAFEIDTRDRADVYARLVLDIDTRLGDHVGH